ncbi:MAG: nuclear transport factor 2 family protein, partial [Pseudomonadota bacterium]
SGTYHSRKDFLDVVNNQLTVRLAGPIRPSVERIFGSGTTVVAQFTSFAPAKIGPDYAQTYCWVMEIADGEICSGTAYLDTALLDRIMA